MSHIDKRRKERVIQLGKSSGGRFTAQLIHDYKRHRLHLRIYDTVQHHDHMFFDVPSGSGELFAAYRTLADVTKAELERLNAEFAGGEE